MAYAQQILDAIPPQHLRETTRTRLDALDRDLQAQTRPAPQAREFHERLAEMPAHLPVPRTSPEPNGH